ncbi:hypothetical protein FJT64_024096 [Amphibalanus amphitrite]|uniref:Uncharacterized protein n=1 Tax=Amphibalanus amphitrite TaxID=1232801 RepID=A0A6A4WD98_AMPAM|nr:hypothetical protein FJT64_024096 [Amphibalanus amphitrite]
MVSRKRPNVCEYRAVDYEDNGKPKVYHFKHRGQHVFRYRKQFLPRVRVVYRCCQGWSLSHKEGCTIGVGL